MLIVKIWQKDLVMQLDPKNLKLFLSFMKKHGSNGLKTFRIGAFQDNYGGVIEFLAI
jgi:hypothetical protein